MDNRRFAELAGICFHEQINSQTLQCKHCGESMLFPWQQNKDFSIPIEVLKVMREREDYGSFRRLLICTFFDDFYAPILDTTGKLRDLAIEFMEGRK